MLHLPALIVVATLAVFTFAADVPATADRDAYNGALAQPRIADKITALEIFATNHRGSPLAEDALEYALWFYISTGGRARTLDVAAQLLRANPNNPLALAVLAHDRRSAAESGLDTERNLRETDRMTNTGLKEYNFMRKPEGMNDAEFTAMKRQVIALLEGDAGYVALQGKRYQHAQLLLKNAVDADPESPQNVYALALSYLGAPKPDRKEGFWYLARTVNLTQGTPAGAQIAQFAATQYQHDGGTPQDWNQFLAATRVPGAPAATAPAAQVEVASATPPTQPPVQPTTQSTAQPTTQSLPRQSTAQTPTTQTSQAQSAAPTVSVEAPVQPAVEQATSAKSAQPPVTPPNDRSTSRAGEQQTIAKADIPPNPTVQVPEPERNKKIKVDYSSGIWTSPGANTPPPPGPIYKRPPNGSPVSLGILIESTHLSKGERDALVKGITGILDDLRDSDEAFILTYGDELVFEQDLTHSPWLLQDAMAHMKAGGGDQALYDAIATSAAHLRRIAKNQNRVLLLISDGQNSQNSKHPLELGWSVREVTVHCMGVDVRSDQDRHFLEALAARTGGRAVFVQDVGQFPSVSMQMAQNIYGPMK